MEEILWSRPTGRWRTIEKTEHTEQKEPQYYNSV